MSADASNHARLRPLHYGFPSPEQRGRAIDLLNSVGLPADDLLDGSVILFIVAQEQDVIGCVGLESHGATGLIHALAVNPAHRGRGIGSALVGRAAALAGAGGMTSLYAVVSGASKFWRRAGYVVSPREGVPPAVHSRTQFSSLLPAEVTVLVRSLVGPITKLGVDELAWHDDEGGARYREVALGRVRFTWYEVPAHATFPPHRHDGEQITCVINGSLIFSDGRTTLEAGPAEVVTVPAHVAHQVWAGPHGALAVDAWSYPMQTQAVGMPGAIR